MKGEATSQYMRHQFNNNTAQCKIGNNNTRRVIFPCLHNPSATTTIPYLENKQPPLETTKNNIKCSPSSDAPRSPIRENKVLSSQSHDEKELVTPRDKISHSSIKKTSSPPSPTSVNVDHYSMGATAMQTPRSILRLPNLHQVSSETDITTISPKSSLHIFDNIRETTDNTPSSHPTHPHHHSHSVSCTTTPPRHIPGGGCPRAVTFDPQVWVHEVQPLPKKTWYTPAELEQFKKEAIETIQRRNFSLVGTGTGVILKREERTNGAVVVGTAFFWGDHRTVDDHPSGHVVKTALIVEPHPTIRMLFERYLTSVVPNVAVTVARDAEEAWRCIRAARLGRQKPMHGFDLILIEERLPRGTTTTMASGSELIHRITLEEKMAKYHPRYSYVIGVSAHLKEDRSKLEMSRADLIWGKPPPSATEELRKSLIESVVEKRKKRT